ncbi:MAG TPA: hypothetical protein VFA89_06165 [Terriglobales bacterium]|nr:hypothetical protein [Terriglobales bacterium]
MRGPFLLPMSVVLCLFVCVCAIEPVPAQSLTSIYTDKPITLGAVPAQDVDLSRVQNDGAAGLTLPTWSGAFRIGLVNYHYTMLGSDPALGSATTLITAVLIPLKMIFSDGTILDATAPVFGETRSSTRLVQVSPLFQQTNFSPGGTNVGTTEYIDAFQRANFWSFVSTTSPNYHVRFKLVTTPVQALTVPLADGYTLQGPGNRLGYVNYSWYDGQLRSLLTRLGVRSNTLAIFLGYNIFQNSPGFVYAGYHTAVGNPAQVYMSAGFFDQKVFSYGGDIIALSHEMGETMDDPFVSNIVPAWSNPQQPGTCSNLLEVGDPVSGLGIGIFVVNGYSYHPEDLAFLPWFAEQVPSTSVNGWYTFGNNYSLPATCP